MLFWQSSLQLHCNWWRFIAMKTHHWIMSSCMGQPRRGRRQYPRSTSFISCKTKSGRRIFCVCWVSWCTQFQTHSNITKPCPATVMFLAARSLCTKDLPARYCMPKATFLQNTRRVWEVSDGTISPRLIGNEKNACYIHSKNAWVTLPIFLGCLSCIRVTKKWYQVP